MVTSILYCPLAPVLRCLFGKQAASEPAEFILNGTFDSEDSWILGGVWSITGGAAEDNGTPSLPGGATLSQTIVQPLKAGRSYTLSFDYTGFASGMNIRVSLAGEGTQNLPNISTSPYSETFVAVKAWDTIEFTAIAREGGTIDNVSLVPA